MEKASQLRVSVVSAKDLVKAKSDAYVVLQLLDEAGKTIGSQRLTQVVKKAITPRWDETISFNVDQSKFVGIQASVWHKQKILADKFMGQVTIKFNNELLASTSIIDDSFPLSARSNKKDSVRGSLQLKIQYGELKTVSNTENNTNNNAVDYKDKNKHENMRVSKRYTAQDLALNTSPFVVVTDDIKSPRREEESMSEEEPEDLPETETTPFEVQFAEVDPREANEEAPDEDEESEYKASEPIKSLEKETADNLLSRAQPIKNEEGDEKNFVMRETSLKPPKTGERINQPFPPPPEIVPELVIDVEEAKKLAKSEAGELQVIRYTPQGNLNHPVTTMSITFNQPMVVLSGIDDLKQADEIVTITPRPAGRFVWKGTETVQFEAEGRFPFATKYTVKIAKGTKSQLNGAFAADFEFEFQTNPPIINAVHYLSNFSKNRWQSGKELRGQGLDCLNPTIAVCYDQRIDIAAVFNRLQVNNAKARLLSIEELDKRLTEYGVDTNEINRGTFFGFDFEKDLAPNASYLISLNEVPSAEGPLLAPGQSVVFSTYPKFGVFQPYHPLYHPRATWKIHLTNPVDYRTFNEKLITVKPPLKNATFKLDNNSSNTAQTVILPGGSFGLHLNVTSLIIENDSEPNTDYTVTVGRELKDVYGQKLTENDTFRLSVTPGYDSLTGPSHLTVLDPSVHPSYTPIVVGYTELKVKVYQVDPLQFFQVAAAFQKYKDQKISRFGKVVHHEVIKTGVEPCTPKQILIDLQKYLQYPKENLGQLVVKVEPTESAWRVFNKNSDDKYRDYHPKLFSWVQCTRLCVDTLYSKQNGDMLVWASHLVDGKPAVDAKISAPNGFNGVANQDGIKHFENFGSAPKGVVMCVMGNDVAFTPIDYTRTTFDSFNWFVFDDRKLYRPKEEVCIKGFARQVTRDNNMRLVPKFASGYLTYAFKDPRGAQISKGSVMFNKFGSFDLKLSLPDNMNLGEARVEFQTTSPPSTFTHTFRVEEFRRPEFEVSSSYIPITNHVATKTGGSAIAKAKATYFAGAGLSDATINWTLQDDSAFYSPPGWSKFSFGEVKPWWLNAPKFDGYTFDGIVGQFFRIAPPSRSYRGGRTKQPRRQIHLDDGFGMFVPTRGHVAAETSTAEMEQSPRHWSAKTDSNGEHEIKVCYSGSVPHPTVLKAVASITDLNSQTRETATSFLLHPSSYYIGVNVKRAYCKPKDLFPMEIIVTDIDGKPLEEKNFWIKQTCEWVADEKEVQKTETKLVKLVSKAQPVVYEYIPVRGGKYTFAFITVDENKLKNETVISFNVSGGKAAAAPKITKVAQETAMIIPDKQVYSPFDGEVKGELLIQSPIKPAEGLLTILCEGIVHTQRFKVEDDSMVVSFPIKEDWQPNAQIQVDLIGASPRALNSGALDLTAPPRPAFAKGLANISIRNKSDVLQVEVQPNQQTYKPESVARVEVQVKDINSMPVANSEVCVIVVDESVLALTGYSIADPLSCLYQQRDTGVGFTYLRSAVLLVSTEDLLQIKKLAPLPGIEEDNKKDKSDLIKLAVSNKKSRKMVPSAEKNEEAMLSMSEAIAAPIAAPVADGAKEENFITVRSNFNALANFSPSCVTDQDGKVSVDFKLPDSLTRYRIWAVAATERQFGIGESSLTVKLPFMVRPSFPRFLNFGDKAECSVVLQNQTEVDLAVRVAARCSNARFGSKFTGGYTLTIPALRRAAVVIPVETKFAGTARFQIVASSEDFSDATEISLPVWTPATTEAFATYGNITDKTVVFQPISPPQGVYKEFGGLEVSTSSTIVQSLTDAVLYLYKDHFECSEELASRILGIVGLKDILQAFNVPELPSTLEILLQLREQLKELRKRQENTHYKRYTKGGFYFWARPADSYHLPDPFLSVHVTNCLAKSIEKGVTVDKDLVTDARLFLHTLEEFLELYYWWMSQYTKRCLLAYSYYVRYKLGENVVHLAKTLYAMAGNEGVTMEALGWLIMAMSFDSGRATRDIIDKILVFLKNRSNETAETAHFITQFADQEGKYVMLHSDRRTDGILLETFLTVDKQNSIIPKIAKGLLAHRKAGRWKNTQENCFILIALDKYFGIYENEEPNFKTTVWLGEIFAGEQSYVGRSTDTHIINVPMKFLHEIGNTDLTLTKDGPAGRLYFRLAINYAPEDLRLKAACYGFKLTRTYEGVDSASHVTKDENGHWHFKLGKKVRVLISMTTTSRRYHVALVDKLPAGLEIVNSALKGTELGETQRKMTSYGGQNTYNPYRTRVYHEYQWYEHQNLRDERAEAFQSLLWEGHYIYRFLCRATCEGTFVVPPAKAEEMYSPEIFGRSATDIVHIEKKLCLQSQTPKIFIADHFTPYGTISAIALLEIVKSYQVIGLDIKGLPTSFKERGTFTHILTASKQLSWVNMARLIKEVPKKNANITSTATSVVFRNYNMINVWSGMFPNLRDARLQIGFLSEVSLQFETNPNIKIFRCTAKSFEKAPLILDAIKTRIPNLEELHMYVYERADTEQYTPKQRLEQLYKPLEKKAEELGFKLYCRNLFMLVNDADVFIESYNHQNMPYNYYRSSAPVNRTLLGEAVRQSALPVVEFLLENEITSLDMEVGPYPEAPLFHKCPLARLRGEFPFLVDSAIAKESTIPMLDYLLAKGFDINKKVNGKTFFEQENLSNPTIFHLVSHSNVDWTIRSSDGTTIIHNIFQSAALEMFRYAAQKIPHELMQELLNAQDGEGDTPLHFLYNCPEEIFDEISKYQLNWETTNKAGATPLRTLVETLRYDNLASHFRRMLPLVSSIQLGVVSTVFTKHRSANVLLPEIELFASRGANLNEVFNETPAVLTLNCFSEELVRELVKHGVNIHVVDKNNQTLLFNVLTSNIVLNRVEIIELLVREFKFDINHLSNDNLTPLTFAMKNKHSNEIIAKLLELGANPNLCGPKFLPPLGHVTAINYNAITALTIVETLLKAGANPNQHVYSDDNVVVFMPLVKLLNAYDSTPMLTLLLEYGARLRIKDEIENSLLHLLKHPCHIEHLLSVLDVNAVNDLGQTPLWAPNLHKESLIMMLKRNANFNHVATDGSTPLHCMVRNHFHSIDHLRILLSEKDIDMSVVNKIGQSFAHAPFVGPVFYTEIIAAYNRCTDERKAKIRAAFNHVDIFGGTVLMYLADARVNVATVKLVVETFELDGNPNTNITLQATWLPEVIEYFLACGFDPNKQSANGNTLLHSVCGKVDKLEIVKMLLKFGASIDIKNIFGVAPVDIDPNIRKSYYGPAYSDTLTRETVASQTLLKRVNRYAWRQEDNISSDEELEDE